MDNLSVKRGATFLDDEAERMLAGYYDVAASSPKGKSSAKCYDPPEGEHLTNMVMVRASDLKLEPFSWLWNGYLAAGKVHIIGGQPGTGKTTIALSLAATSTVGGRWPDGTKAVAGSVVIWSGEDDPADTLAPRLLASGADLSRVYFVEGVRDGNERRSFDPARDIPALRRKLIEIGDIRLLIVDPIVAAISGDSHKNAEVRRGLQPLADLAASMRCALLGITHFSKGTSGRDPTERITGSLAFGALARVVMVCAKHQTDGEDDKPARVFLRCKSNLGRDDGGFEYDLHQSELEDHPGIFASSVSWGKAVEGNARDLLATADAVADQEEGNSPLGDAVEFLKEALAHGSKPSSDLKEVAKSEGIAERTLTRAREKLGIKAVRQGFGKGSMWFLPADPTPTSEPFRPKNINPATQNSVATMANGGLNGPNECLDPGRIEVEI